MAGDLAYPNGAETEFLRCFDSTWGRHRSRITPAPGIHDFIAPNAQGYFNYFGPIAGDPTKGYYSYNYGAWHVVIINDICSSSSGVNGCTATSPEGLWLQSDLAANPVACTVAIWHQPLYTSMSADVTTAMRPFWQILYNAGADLVLNGHAHNYERFAPQDPNGNLDLTKGLREFVVGTGLHHHGAQQRSPEFQHFWCTEADVARDQLRLAVRTRRRSNLHRFRHSGVPLTVYCCS